MERDPDYSTMERDPDYIGNFLFVPMVAIADPESVFRMFVDVRTSQEDGSEGIEGRITDRFGNATFQGKITETHIDFRKQYDPDAISKGGHFNPIPYEGDGTSGKYVGKFTIVNGLRSNLATGEKTRGDWEDYFILERWDVSEMKEFIN